jgi:hypothetical protein
MAGMATRLIIIIPLSPCDFLIVFNQGILSFKHQNTIKWKNCFTRKTRSQTGKEKKYPILSGRTATCPGHLPTTKWWHYR